jgi:hypothetical protein
VQLTLGVYTHVELPDQVAAIGALPAPPKAKQAVSKRNGDAGKGKKQIDRRDGR